MAGLGRKVWDVLDVLGAADVNGYLMDQSVMVFADASARTTAVPTPTAGMVVYRIDGNVIEFFDGTDWVDLVSSSDLGELADVNVAGLQNLDSLIWDGTQWVNQRLNLADAGDVNLTTPGVGEYLAYDDGASEWVNAEIALGDLSDVDVSNAFDNASLYYDENTSQWIPYQIGFEDLVDAQIFTPLGGEIIVYNDDGGVWENDGTTYQKTVQKNQVDGYAGLDAGGKLNPNQIPSLAITDTFVVADETERLALTAAETGDIAVQTDTSKTFILQGTDPSVAGDWVKLLFPPDAVDSVNGETGVVVLDTDDITEGVTNLYFTDQRADDRADGRIAAATTDDVSEGVTNLYFTDARVDAVIANSDTDDLAEGATNLYYTDNRVESVIGNASIDDLGDVNIVTPADGEILTYDGTAGEWYNGSAPAGTLAGLSDVDVDGVTDGQAIVYSASLGEWIPGDAGGKFAVSDTAPPTPTNGDTWFNSSTGLAYIFYVDVNSAQWVQLGGGGGGSVGSVGFEQTFLLMGA